MRIFMSSAELKEALEDWVNKNRYGGNYLEISDVITHDTNVEPFRPAEFTAQPAKDKPL